MRHIVIGGDGFVGHILAANLEAQGEHVLIADINRSSHEVYAKVPFVHLDVTRPESFAAIDLQPEDMVYNLSAKMLSPIMPKAKRHDFFYPVNYFGTKNILEWMDRSGARRLVHYTTDMVYGHSVVTPQTEDHPCAPLGHYGQSKLDTETLAAHYRGNGFRISIFRPRLIIGPGRLGILEKLFKLIDANLPVPMIGSGRNPYQFVSVFDCASAAELAWKAGVPNEAYNLGSDTPPSVRELLGRPDPGGRQPLDPAADAGAAGEAHAQCARRRQPAVDGSRAIPDRRRGLPARLLQGQAAARLVAAVSRRRHADRRLQGIPGQEGSRPRPRRQQAAAGLNRSH